jgi:antitoxin MazE
MAQQAVTSNINQWGNGLAVRLGKLIARAAGVQAGTPVRIVAEPGRIVIEAVRQEQTLEEMLAGFDLKRHGGEAMAFTPRGREVL